MRDEEIYKEAAKKVKAKKGFFYHLIAYAFVIGMLYAIMHFENNGEMLPVIIVALSWGIGLAAHYFSTFGTKNLEFLGINADWEEDALEEEIERLSRKRELKERIREEKMRMEDPDGLELREIEKRLRDEDIDF